MVALRRIQALPFMTVAIVLGCGIAPIGAPDGAARGDSGLDGAMADAHDAGTRRLDAGPPPEALDAYIAWEMDRGGIAGLAAAIVTADGIRWTGFYGFADIESGQQVTDSTIFHVASLSKPVATVTLLQLIEAGTLEVDAPVDDLVASVPRHPEHPDTSLTIRQLLTHTSGITDNLLMLGRATATGMDSPMSLDEFIAAYLTPGGVLYSDGSWGAAPGAARSYSNAAYAVVGHLVDATTPEGFRARSHALLFEPLAMSSTAWTLAETNTEQLATGYSHSPRSGFSVIPPPGPAYYPAGGLRTTASDLARFLRMLLRRGELDGHRVLHEDLVDAMMTPQVADIAPYQGYSLTLREHDGHPVWGHGGSTTVGSAQLALAPADGVGYFVLTNSDAYFLAEAGVTIGADALDRIVERIAREALVP